MDVRRVLVSQTNNVHDCTTASVDEEFQLLTGQFIRRKDYRLDDEDKTQLTLRSVNRHLTFTRGDPLASNVPFLDVTTGHEEINVVCKEKTDSYAVEHFHESCYFYEAKNVAKVPFLFHAVLECDNGGLEYTVEGHDVSLRIPKGAVPEGMKLHFEIGVTMYGPFNFPKNTQPISPIVWLCVLEGHSTLIKPFQLIIPHFLTGLTKDRLRSDHHVHFAKASHTSVDKQMMYSFNPCEIQPFFASSGDRSYGILISNHCCFYCLERQATDGKDENAKDIGYSLARIQSSTDSVSTEVYFAVTYTLETCRKALEEQVSKDGYTIAKSQPFKFNPVAKKYEELHIKASHTMNRKPRDIAWDPNPPKIRACDVHFWDLTYNEMKRRHEAMEYPPRVKMTVVINKPSHPIKLLIKFDGCFKDDQLNFDLVVPSGHPGPFSSIPSTSHARGSQPESSIDLAHINITEKIQNSCKERSFIYKQLLPLSSYWRTIGGLLGMALDDLKTIQSDNNGVNDCLYAMISKSLKQVEKPPTWRDLIDAIQSIDQEKAEKLKKDIYTQRSD